MFDTYVSNLRFEEEKTNPNPLTCWGKREKQNVSLPQSQKRREYVT